jgi:NodT family efflux transporter outer membrane factor (OMF) lipoprotein
LGESTTLAIAPAVSCRRAGGAASAAPWTFQAPEAPHDARFVAAGQLPLETAATALPGGEAQRFVDGQDIPGQWWTLFQSAQLNALIERALKNSPTLESAQAALRQAKEITAAQRGSYYPSVSGSLESQRQKASGAAFGVPGFPASYFYNLDTAQVNVSYTLDVFGGTRRQVESLQAQAEYQQFALEASYITLTANIVTAAVNEASLRAQIAATEHISQSQQAQLGIVTRRLSAGGASRADVLQQQAVLQATLASLPLLRSQLAQQRNQLAAFLGSLPAEYTDADFELDSLTMPQDLPVSLPSKFVEQRPDVREYSALLHAATAQVGVATANMLPQITLTGSYGQASPTVDNLFAASSNVWNVIGTLAQPIFKGGQLKHLRRAAVAAAQEAAANYRATVVVAFQNVSDTLYALNADADALAAQSLADHGGREPRHGAGAVPEWSRQLRSSSHRPADYQTAAVALIKARAQRFADTAALFQALGGGWWNRGEPLADIQKTREAP